MKPKFRLIVLAASVVLVGILVSLSGNNRVTSAPAPFFATCTWDGSSGTWTDSIRWSCGAVPGASDTAIVPSGTVTVPSAVTIANLQLTGGTITCNDNLTITTTMSWTSGTINGTSSGQLTLNGILTMSGNTQKFLAASLINNGTINWQGGQFILSSTLTNQSSGIFNIEAAGPLSAEGGIVVNAGNINKITNSTSQLTNVTLNNSGTVNVNAGMLKFAGGTHTISPTGNLNGSGTLDLSGTTTTINGAFNFTGTLNISGGTTNLNTSTNLSSLNLASGTLAGTGAVTVVGSMIWSGGSIDGSGSFTIPAGVTLTMSGSSQKFFSGRTLTNNGTISWLGGQFVLSSTLTNQVGATLAFQSSGPLTGGTLINAGTLTKSTATNLLCDAVTVNNSGIVNVDGGVLNISGFAGSTTNNSGAYNVALGTTLGFGIGTHTINPSGSVNGAGLVQFSGTTNFSGSFNVTGDVSINGGSVSFNTNTNIKNLNFTSGSLLGSGAVAILTGMNWSGGTISRMGSMTIQPGGTLDITGTTFKFLESTLTNSGTTNYVGAHLQINGGGLFGNALTGTFNLNTDNPLEGAGSIQNAGVFVRNGGLASIVRPQFTNTGSLEITSTNLSFLDFFSQPQTITQTTGTTRLNNATLSANLTINGGQLTGTGSVDGDVTNAGIIAPGLIATSAGTITITKNYTQTAAGSLNIELGGTNPGVDSDLLVTNTAASTTTNLLGTMNVGLVSGFHPAADTSFQVARYATHTGSFTTTNGLDMGGGQLLNADYRNTELVLVGGSGGPAVPWVQVIAEPPKVRGDAGTPFKFQYRVEIGNSGGEASTVVVVLEITPDQPMMPIDHDDIEGSISNDPLVPVDDPGEFAQIPKKIFKDDGTVLIPIVMQLPAGSTFSLRGGFKSKCAGLQNPPPLPGDPPLGEPKAKVFGHAMSLPSAECLSDLLKFALGFLPAKDCVDEILKFILKQSVPLEFGRPVNAVSFLASALALVAKCAFKSIPAVKIALEIYKYLSKGKEALQALNSCIGSIFPDPESPELNKRDHTDCVVSKDPNDKVGPAGVGVGRFISGAEGLPYVVFFENVPTASAPAQTVRITDQLDPSLVNFNTVALGDISFADKNVTPPPNTHTFTKDVDMRPGKNVIVRINAGLNFSTGVLTWLFTSIDPATGLPLPPTSPDGFLDPNLLPPQGQGLVTFSVTPKTGLPSGSIIRNKASIVFDQNTPIDTPEWFNTSDNIKPSSKVQPLASAQCASFRVQWSGADETSGVAHYSVFVSKDGGTYEPWLLHTTKTSDFFNGVAGSTYGFYTVARDGAGNVEVAPSQPDTTTTVTTTMSISPGGASFNAQGGTGSIEVTAGGCEWIAESRNSFITVTGGGTGTGNGSVTYSVATNTTNVNRDGEILVAGHHFVVSQSATSTPPPATIELGASAYVVGEDQQVSITAVRTGDTSIPVSAAFSTNNLAGAQACNVVNGAASSRCDYESSFRTIHFAAGEVSKTVTVLLIDDTYLEGPETLSVTLTNPSGAVLGAVSTATITITDNDLVSGPNPIEIPLYFVRQHYLDFFTRQPDSGGLGFWTNEITSCGNNQCIEVKRINVSAAFYLSIEFQRTGYLIERLYKTAFGDASGASILGGAHQLSVPIIRLDEFLADAQEVGSGVIVGQQGWEQVLENNKVAFIADFVQRSRFTSAFPLSMAPAQFVDQLNSRAGNPLSPPERDQLVNDLTAGTKTRTQVLRAVAEDSDLNSGEFNRAFVLMQYFGYLRRNPNDAPDSDYTGYDFWLTKLNQFNGNFINAEMVKAFISSGEYRQRFGP